LLFLMVACGSESENPWPEGDPPDVTGRYNTIPGGTTGCDGEPSWITGWADGPLEISGDPENLSFEFISMLFIGAVQADHSYSFGGLGSWGANEISVYNEGWFSVEDARWVMEGTFDVVVYDPEFTSEDCTITGPVKAYQISR
jgi:hypothetical protein